MLYSAGAAGPVTDSFPQPGRYKLTGGLQMGVTPLPKVLTFGTSCQTGVNLTFLPRGRVKVYSEARTADHKIAALALQGARPGRMQLVVTRQNGQKTIITIHVYPLAPYDHGNVVKT